jgi:hypothetical protein
MTQQIQMHNGDQLIMMMRQMGIKEPIGPPSTGSQPQPKKFSKQQRRQRQKDHQNSLNSSPVMKGVVPTGSEPGGLLQVGGGGGLSGT